MKKYIYCINKKALSNNGFTSKSNKWILFSEEEKIKFETNNLTPYGAFRKGIFLEFTT